MPHPKSQPYTGEITFPDSRPGAAPYLGERFARALPMLCVALALGTLLLPVAVTPMPPLLDYPNHLARMWLLAGGIDQAPMNAMYGINWSGASTNIGIDLVAVTLGRLVGGWTLGPLLLGAAVLLPPLGAVLLNRAVFGGWHWWQAGFAVLAWNTTLVAGFLNFQIGVGLAFIAAALGPMILWRASPWCVVLVQVALGAVLLLFHPFAAGLYGMLLAALAFGSGHGADAGVPLARRVKRAIGAAGPAVGLPVAALLLFAPTLPGGHAPAGLRDPWAFFTVANKAATLATAIATYDLRLDIAAVALLWIAARFTPSVYLLRAHAGLLLAAASLVVLALLVPTVLGDTAFLDWRFPVMAVLALVAAVRPQTDSVRVGHALAVALALLALARTGWIADVWHERQADVAAVEDVLTLVPGGAAVLPVQHQFAEGRPVPWGRQLVVGLATFWHLPTLAVPLRHAFVPTLFTVPGKQPLRVLSPWSSMAIQEGNPAPVNLLRHYEPSVARDYWTGFMAHWRDRFDYVLVLNADVPDPDDEASVPGLELLSDRGFVRLYRIHRAP